MDTPTTRPASIHLAQASLPLPTGKAQTMALTHCGVQVSIRSGRVTCFAAEATCEYCQPRPKTAAEYNLRSEAEHAEVKHLLEIGF